MEKINERFKEIKKELAELEKKRGLTNVEKEQLKKLSDELMEQIYMLREELDIDK